MGKMRSRKKRKPSSESQELSEINFIPPEVLTQIFTTLPVKTLLRFRCVCKSWCSIIDDPDFVHLHLQVCNNNNINKKKKLVFALESLGRRGVRGRVMTVRQIDGLRKVAQIFETSERYAAYWGCNGLLLMVRYPPCTVEYRVWNPSVRKSLLLPPCPLSSSVCVEPKYAFGFSPHSKEYKFIVLPVEKNQVIYSRNAVYTLGVAVYTLNDQQWSVRNNVFNIQGCNLEQMFFSSWSSSAALYFEGAGHWFGNRICRSDIPTHLVSLDFDLEKFTLLELPCTTVESEASESDGYETLWYLFLLRESLAFISIANGSCSIWVLDKGEGNKAWTLWFSGDSNEDCLNFFNYHRGEPAFYYEKDGGCFIRGNRSYNIASCQMQVLNKSVKRCVQLEPYSESLVLANISGLSHE